MAEAHKLGLCGGAAQKLLWVLLNGYISAFAGFVLPVQKYLQRQKRSKNHVRRRRLFDGAVKLWRDFSRDDVIFLPLNYEEKAVLKGKSRFCDDFSGKPSKMRCAFFNTPKSVRTVFQRRKKHKSGQAFFIRRNSAKPSKSFYTAALRVLNYLWLFEMKMKKERKTDWLGRRLHLSVCSVFSPEKYCSYL